MAKIDKIHEVALAELKLYENNAKKHSEKQIELIANSIKEFGFLSPVIIDMDKNVIAGHGRIKAAEQIGMTEVPCIFVEGLTEEQYKAYVLVDNKLTELGEWDIDLLEAELQNIEIDMSDFGFEDLNIDFEEDEFEPIDDEDIGSTKSVEHSFSIDSKRYPITDEEFDALNKALDDFVDRNGVAYGFIREVLNNADMLY